MNFLISVSAFAVFIAHKIPSCLAATQCPPLQFRTVSADCRYVMGRPVPCEKPMPIGTKASFSCKPFYRLPLQEVPDGGHSSMCREDGNWYPQPYTCVPECGRVKAQGETLIVDGRPVKSGVEYPWHVAVYAKRHKLGANTQICGGSLITTKFFVSAAHCFATKGDSSTAAPHIGLGLLPTSDFAAAVGKIKRSWDENEENEQKREIVNILTRDYGGGRQNHVKDFALVEMASEVDINAFTLPVCVDWSHSERPLHDGDIGVVVGWGNLWNQQPSEHLQVATLPFVPLESCMRIVPSSMVQYILLPGDRFCAGVLNGTTVAHGDSGGGLAFSNKNRVWFLRGVVSVGMPDRRTFATFTNVTSFVRYMADIIQDDEIRAAATVHEVPMEIPMDYTASNLEEEQRLAFFREDLGANVHHMHWHANYPWNGAPEMLTRDRRGELMQYMHYQVTTRYNFERLANGLNRVKRIVDFHAPIKEGYYPKMDNLVSTRVWPPRAPNTALSNINRDNIQIDIDDLERWRDRLYEAINMRAYVSEDGKVHNFTEETGIDVLANMVESSTISPNRKFYGDLVNMGHVAISLAHDPDSRFLEPYSVMGDATVALRDPVFYRWHATIADIFQAYKKTLLPYTRAQVDFPGVSVTDVQVMVTAGPSAGRRRPNELLTHWQKSDLALSRGLDLNPRGPLFVRVTHLQHRPFVYKIRVDNDRGRPTEAYARIFLAPKFDERGRPFMFSDQRLLVIEMDKFPVTLKPGMNVIERSSKLSSVTIPFERTFRDLDRSRPAGGDALQEFTFCGCGWPQHMLVPRGTAEGFPAQLFVILSDYSKDKIDQVLHGQCNDAPSLCGVRNGKYPDRRAMGYPFDRLPRRAVYTAREFLTPNMFLQDVTIKFEDVTETLKRNLTIFGTGNEARPLRPLKVSSVSPGPRIVYT